MTATYQTRDLEAATAIDRNRCKAARTYSGSEALQRVGSCPRENPIIKRQDEGRCDRWPLAFVKTPSSNQTLPAPGGQEVSLLASSRRLGGSVLDSWPTAPSNRGAT
jgi:hypothetical protein